VEVDEHREAGLALRRIEADRDVAVRAWKETIFDVSDGLARAHRKGDAHRLLARGVHRELVGRPDTHGVALLQIGFGQRVQGHRRLLVKIRLRYRGVTILDGHADPEARPGAGPHRSREPRRPPLGADDWQIERRNRALGRKLRHETVASRRRVDSPQNLFDELAQQTATPILTPGSHAPPRRTNPQRRPEIGQFLAWLIALTGASLLGCGVGALGWSFAHGGTEIWDPAIGLTLTGQGILIFGLLLVATRLWRNSRYASSQLQQVHTELGQLQRTADALTAMRGGGAPAFYAELVRGASPQMLLTNLKGQLDQLATRLNGEL